jgi:hypothetical protein
LENFCKHLDPFQEIKNISGVAMIVMRPTVTERNAAPEANSLELLTFHQRDETSVRTPINPNLKHQFHDFRQDISCRQFDLLNLSAHKR